jgi:multiple sugar transport system permease protein
MAIPDTFAPADTADPGPVSTRLIPGGGEDSLAPAAVMEYLPRFPHAKGQAEDITSRRITAILPLADGGVLLGGPNGVLSLLDAAGGAVASATAPLAAIYVHWRNYIDLWRNIDFGLYLKNSFIVCVGVMLVAMVLASMGGYALARFNFPGKNLFGYSVLATQMVPGIMLLIPLYLMFINFGKYTGLIVKGSYGGLILTYAAYFVPFSIWILRGFFASLPKELEEAALVDGCGPLQAFFRIIIPSAMPGIIATGVYVFLSAWDELMFAWVLTDERTYTIPVGIRLFVGNFQNRYDLMMAAATVSTIPVMILFFLMQRHIVSGLTAGAVKE